MKSTERIEGIHALLARLPEAYQHWHLFGENIKSFYFERKFDCEKKFEEIACITMILADKADRFHIKMELRDVCGDIHFDAVGGFFSGLEIIDTASSYAQRGWEQARCFILRSFEQDISFEIRCDSISVELTDCS